MQENELVNAPDLEQYVEAPVVFAPEPAKISIAEACEVMECGIETIRQMLHDGELPGLKRGKRWVIPRQAFYRRMNELAELEAERRRAGVPVRAPEQAEERPARRGPGRPRRKAIDV